MMILVPEKTRYAMIKILSTKKSTLFRVRKSKINPPTRVAGEIMDSYLLKNDLSFSILFVRGEGLEPSCLAAYEPQS